jgi:nitrogenase subunit NifH
MYVLYGAYTTNADVVAKKTFLSSFVCGGYALPLFKNLKFQNFVLQLSGND